jgi:SAM-dependent methyltransferase
MAEAYERIGVPTMFETEARGLLEIAALQPGEQILDVACGTGIVARLAAPRLGANGQVVGLDLNEAMLAVARAQPLPAGAPVEWRQGNAQALPFADATFDAVLCQNGLQFMPDRALALREMQRVLRRERRLVLSVVRREAASQAIEASVGRHLGPDAVSLLDEPFRLGQGDALANLLAGVGFRTVDLTGQHFTAHCPSAETFLAFTLRARLASVLEQMPPDEHAALLSDALSQLTPYRSADGLAFPVEMLVVMARI